MQLLMCSGESTALGSLMTTIGEAQVQSKMAKLKEAEANSTLDRPSLMTRLNVSKEGCTFIDNQWVPTSLREKKCLPDSVGTIGVPWIQRTMSGSFRHGSEDMPFFGFGHFVQGVTGSMYLCAWPLGQIVDLAVQCESGLETLAGLPKVEFSKTVRSVCFHCLIQHGTSVWIPHGWASVMIALQDTPATHTIVVPYMSVPLLKPVKLTVRREIIKAFERWQRSEGGAKKPWTGLAPAFLSWLRGNLAADNFPKDNDNDSDTDVAGDESGSVLGMNRSASGIDVD